jgi:N6-L-threonylcarbamoyladenine synthase
MLILGIDTSCDDTAAAVVENGVEIVSNIVSSQTDIHKKYGGIVPELASRRHVEMILPVIDEALEGAGAGLEDVAAVAVCHGPGLIGSLLVGCSFAKAVCFSKSIPLIAVNHLEGHMFSCFLEEPLPEFPFISLIASGGHTSLYRIDGFGKYRELGRTRDDASGEAYDKVSKLLGLGYPGGPIIDKLASEGNPKAIDFSRPYLPESFDFSFSGLKTAVLHYLMSQRRKGQNTIQDTVSSGSSPGRRCRIQDKNIVNREFCIADHDIKDIAASFQACMVDVLVRKTEWAIKKEGIRRVALSGGVSANSELRKRMKEMGDERGAEIFIPPINLCTDNAAMIASAGYHHFLNKDFAGIDLNPKAYLPL